MLIQFFWTRPLKCLLIIICRIPMISAFFQAALTLAAKLFRKHPWLRLPYFCLVFCLVHASPGSTRPGLLVPSAASGA
jgi:hypothetical protein